MMTAKQGATPILRILATGGTIAGQRDATASGGYHAARRDVTQLLEAVPQLHGLPARIQAQQLLQKDSKDMDPQDWLAIATATWQALQDPQVTAVVITHGTDTLEETAWFLHRVLPAQHKPVVLVSAMRPADAPDADGPRNLYDGCVAALDGRFCGVVAVAAGEVHAAQYVQKVHPWALRAFSSGVVGPLGQIQGGAVTLHTAGPEHDAAMPAGGHAWLLQCAAERLPAPPVVGWLTSHAGFDARWLQALAGAGLDGLLVATTGNGTLHHNLEIALQQLARQTGLAIALTSRCAFGPINAAARARWTTLALPAAKARLEWQLQLWQRSWQAQQAGKAQ
ncbi:asparaginase [Lampropedia cohaerens]|nr:asparaginase [Lampropedia cohaerens]